MDFCDLTCRFASWPEQESLDGAGSCRTFQALYCAKKRRHVRKNMPCAEKTRAEEGGGSPLPGHRET